MPFLFPNSKNQIFSMIGRDPISLGGLGAPYFLKSAHFIVIKLHSPTLSLPANYDFSIFPAIHNTPLFPVF